MALKEFHPNRSGTVMEPSSVAQRSCEVTFRLLLLGGSESMIAPPHIFAGVLATFRERNKCFRERKKREEEMGINKLGEERRVGH